jgi:hypothetical protein
VIDLLIGLWAAELLIVLFRRRRRGQFRWT